MKAIYSSKSAGRRALVLTDRPIPEPGPAEVLVRVHYASVTRGDILLQTIPRPLLVIMGTLFGFKPMDTPGVEFSGTVEKVGTRVSRFSVGDLVSGTSTGLGYGANAEYVVVQETSPNGVLVHRPQTLDVRDATLILVGGMTALQILDRVKVQSGDRVLVYGASGSVGSYVLQIAKAEGATVHAVCGPDNLQSVKDLGADEVYNYKGPEFTALNQPYTVVIDAVGKLSPKDKKRLLAPGGRFASTKAPTKERTEDVQRLFGYLQAGTIKVLVDSEIDLADVPRAHERVKEGHKRGNIGVRIAIK